MDEHDTPLKALLVVPPAAGTLSTVQVLPSQISASGTDTGGLPAKATPTAVQSVAEMQDTD
jgi:hypothetical protein